MSCSRFAVRATCASISVVSVSSSTSADGLMPAWAMAARTSSGKLGRCICCAATFTDTVKPGPLELRIAPAPRLAARLAQHPVADRHEQPGVFGDSEEVLGQQQTPGGVPPAQERLDAVDRAGAQSPRSAGSRAGTRRRSIARCNSASTLSRVNAPECRSLSKNSKRLRPRRLAWCMAASARRKQLVAVRRAVTERHADAHGDGQTVHRRRPGAVH